jgi:hypothetical protein
MNPIAEKISEAIMKQSIAAIAGRVATRLLTWVSHDADVSPDVDAGEVRDEVAGPDADAADGAKRVPLVSGNGLHGDATIVINSYQLNTKPTNPKFAHRKNRPLTSTTLEMAKKFNPNS